MAGSKSSFSVLRHGNFRWLWLGTFFGTGAHWVQQATLGWVVYQLTGSGAMLGGILAMRAIPMLLLAPLTGVVADRYDRRRVLVLCQALLFTISAIVSLLLATGLIRSWHFYVFSLLSGVGWVFDRTLRSTMVFGSVPRAEAAHAVALNTIAFSVMRTVGPSVAGILIAAVGAALNFGIQATLFLCVMASSWMIGPQPPQPRTQARVSAFQDLRAGVHFVANDPIARMMLLFGLVPGLLLIPSFSALMPMFVVNVFHGGPKDLGLLLSAVGVGGVMGGIAVGWLTRFDRVGRMQTLALIAFAGSLIAFAMSPSIGLALAFLVCAGMAEMVAQTLQVTTLQMCAPEHMRGRVASLLPIFPAFISIGGFTAGIGADLVGPKYMSLLLAVSAIGVVATGWACSAAFRRSTLSGLIKIGGAVPASRH